MGGHLADTTPWEFSSAQHRERCRVLLHSLIHLDSIQLGLQWWTMLDPGLSSPTFKFLPEGPKMLAEMVKLKVLGLL